MNIITIQEEPVLRLNEFLQVETVKVPTVEVLVLLQGIPRL